MNEPSRSKIHPGWFFAGGVGIAVVGLCVLIALGGIGLALLLSPQRSSNDNRQATQAAAEPTDTASLLVTLTRVLGNFPTQLPIISTSGVIPTSILPPSQPSTAPEQAVRTYYNLVSEEQYDQTWNMLTDAFKQKFNCCSPNYNYTGYMEWWDSVDRVEFGSVRTISQTENRAVVYAEITYVMNDGNRSSIDGSYFMLIYDPAIQIWRFDDRRANL